MKTATRHKLKQMLITVTPKEEREILILEDNESIRQSIQMVAEAIGGLNEKHSQLEKDLVAFTERSIEKARGNITDDMDSWKEDIGQRFETIKTEYSKYETKTSSRTETISKGLQKEFKDQIDSLYKEIAGLNTRLNAPRANTWGGASIITYLYGSVISPQNMYNQINWIFVGCSVTAVNNNSTQQVDVTVTVTGGGGSANFIDQEIPSGTVNGINASFGLTHAPTPAKSLMLFVNGANQFQGSDYTLSTTAITFNASAIPGSGSLLQAWYRY